MLMEARLLDERREGIAELTNLTLADVEKLNNES